MSNPIDDYLELAEKRAGFGDFARSAAQGAGRAFSGESLGKLVMQTGMIAGASALLGAAGKAIGAATKSSDFKKMLEVNPDLAQLQSENPAQFNQFYTSLRNLNPAFAADPVVAGSYLRQMSEFPVNAGSILVQSVGAAPRPAQSRIKDLSLGLDIADRGAPPSPFDAYKMQEARAKALKAERGLYAEDEL